MIQDVRWAPFLSGGTHGRVHSTWQTRRGSLFFATGLGHCPWQSDMAFLASLIPDTRKMESPSPEISPGAVPRDRVCQRRLSGREGRIVPWHGAANHTLLCLTLSRIGQLLTTAPQPPC